MSWDGRSGYPGAGRTVPVDSQHNNYGGGSTDYNNRSVRNNMSVKYPPSMQPIGGYPKQEPYRSTGSYGPDPPRHGGGVSSSYKDVSRKMSSMSTFTVNDIIKQLELATSENERLRMAIAENNEFFEHRCAEMQESSKTELEDEVKMLKEKVSESTNRFCEARVAVLGFKCRVIQLSGELEKARLSGGGAPSENFKQLQEKLDVCEKDKKKYAEAEHKVRVELNRANAENANLREDLTGTTHQINQLHYQLQEKDKHIQHLNDYLSKTQQQQQQQQGGGGGEQQNQHVHTLMGQVQELTRKNKALESSVSNLKEDNDDLRARNKKLEQNRDVMMEKLEHATNTMATSPSSSGASVPVPKPRTTVSSSDRERLEREIKHLKDENSQLKEEREKSDKSRGTLDNMFQDANRKSQSLKEEVLQKEREVAVTRDELAGAHHKLEMVQQERILRDSRLDALKGELDKMKRDLRALERERQDFSQRLDVKDRERAEAVEDLEEMRKARDDARVMARKYRSQVTELEGKVSTQSMAVGGAAEGGNNKSMKLGMSAAHRLNEALGNIKRLEEAKVSLEDRLHEEKEERGVETRRLRTRLETLETELNTEREQSRRSAEEDFTRLQQENEQLSQQLMELESSKSSSVDSVRLELEHTKTSWEQEKEGLTQQLTSHQDVVERQAVELQQVKAELSKRDKKTDKFESLQSSYSDLKTRCQELGTASKEKESQMQQLLGEREHLLKETEHLKNACEEYRKESESILQDYNTCAQRLKLSQDESTRWNREYSHQQDRVGLLEKNRKELEEKLAHMDQQIKVFQEDYDREREAREAALKVKSLAENKMNRMEEELRECRERLNNQAASQMTYDDSHTDRYSSYRVHAPQSQNPVHGGMDFHSDHRANRHPASSSISPSSSSQLSNRREPETRPVPGGGGIRNTGSPAWTQIANPPSSNIRSNPQRPMTSISSRQDYNFSDYIPPVSIASSKGSPSMARYNTGPGGVGPGGIGSGGTGPGRMGSGGAGTGRMGPGPGGMGSGGTGPGRVGPGPVGMSSGGTGPGGMGPGGSGLGMNHGGTGTGPGGMSVAGTVPGGTMGRGTTVPGGRSRMGAGGDDFNPGGMGMGSAGIGMGGDGKGVRHLGGREMGGLSDGNPPMGPITADRQRHSSEVPPNNTAGGPPDLMGPKHDESTDAPPLMACPICGRSNFKTQNDLEFHSSGCTGAGSLH